MGNTGGSLQFGPPDEDEEGEEDNGEHLSQAVGMSGIHSAVEENDGDIASDGGRTAECVSIEHLVCHSIGFNHHSH